MSPDLTSLTLVAQQAMDLAETHVRTHKPGLVIPKGDCDMATDVDLAIERMIRKFLAETTPTIGFLGEEEGRVDAQTRWVLDPLDGTANFACGVPLNGISLALVYEQHAMLGVIALMLGSAAVDLAWVADGTLDASITLGNRAWDMAAGTVIARHAGAALFDADGTPHTTSSRFTIAAAPALRNDVLAAVQAATRTDPATVPASGVAVSQAAPHTADDDAITGHRQHGAPY